jgi:methyl-accepting chemotaxis protein
MGSATSAEIHKAGYFSRLLSWLAGGKGEESKVSLLIWSGFLILIMLSTIVGGSAWISFQSVSAAFNEYDRVIMATNRVLLIDRDIVGLRRNFAVYVRTGEESKMQTILERGGAIDNNLKVLREQVLAPDRRALLEQIGGVILAMRSEILRGAELRRVRESRFAELDPIGQSLRIQIGNAVEGDRVAAMDVLMRLRLNVLRFLGDPDDKRRSLVETNIADLGEVTAKLSYADNAKAEVERMIRDFRAGFKNLADVTSALDRLVDETVEGLGQQSSDLASKLRGLQMARVDQLQAKFSGDINTGLQMIGLLALVALIVGVIAATLIARMVMAPIKEMAKAATVAGEIGEIIGAASDGDLRNRVILDGRTGFVRTIGSHVNSLFDSFTATITTVRGTVSALSDAIVVSSGAVTEVHAGAGSQAAALQQVRDALNISVKSVCSANESAQDASTSADFANQLVTSATGTMHHLSETIGSIAANSRKIAQLNASIAEIAQRTNILATSTAIEAARNAAEGSVFGVIAQQVNALSESCGSVARQIADVMEESRISIESGLASSAEVEGAISAIQTRVEETDTKLRHICEAMVSQQASATEISAAVDHLFQIAEQNVQATLEISRTQEQLRALGDETSASMAMFRVDA